MELVHCSFYLDSGHKKMLLDGEVRNALSDKPHLKISNPQVGLNWNFSI